MTTTTTTPDCEHISAALAIRSGEVSFACIGCDHEHRSSRWGQEWCDCGADLHPAAAALGLRPHAYVALGGNVRGLDLGADLLLTSAADAGQRGWLIGVDTADGTYGSVHVERTEDLPAVMANVVAEIALATLTQEVYA